VEFCYIAFIGVGLDLLLTRRVETGADRAPRPFVRMMARLGTSREGKAWLKQDLLVTRGSKTPHAGRLIVDETLVLTLSFPRDGASRESLVVVACTVIVCEGQKHPVRAALG